MEKKMNCMEYFKEHNNNSKVPRTHKCPKDFYHTGHVVNFEYWVQKNF